MFRTPIMRLKQFLMILLVMFVIIIAVSPSSLGTIASGVGQMCVAIIGAFGTIFSDIYHAVVGNSGVGHPSVHL
jgi:threonine/homoserine/homoserine lactone efflux protein